MLLHSAVRRSFMRLPTRWRVALASFGLLVILLGGLGVVISLVVEQSLFANEATALQDEAQLALNGTKGHPLTLPSSSPALTPPGPVPVNVAHTAQDLVNRLTSANVRATVLTPAGTVVATSNNLPPIPPPVSPDSHHMQQAFTSLPHAEDYVVDSQLVVLLPLMHGQQIVALLQLSTTTTFINSSITTLHLILLVGILSALALAAAVTLPLMSAALRPLIQMERTSRRIANGALSLRLDVTPANDEIGRLARSFNSMVAQLEAAFMRQRRFVADVSHELRTPLTTVSAGLELMLSGVGDSNIEVQHRLLRDIYSEVGRMQRLVEDLLALARIDEGRAELRKEPIDLQVLLSNVYEQAQHLASGQHLHLQALPESITLYADYDRLQQVLLNLLDNALKFTPAPGDVRLAGWREGDAVVLEVCDTGIGIPADALPHVFDRFYRADPARARLPHQLSGNGLGLSLVREIIEAHNGTITLESREGEGTRARIRLPYEESYQLQAI